MFVCYDLLNQGPPEIEPLGCYETDTTDDEREQTEPCKYFSHKISLVLETIFVSFHLVLGNVFGD